MKEAVQSILKRYGKDKSRMMDILLDIQSVFNCVPDEAIEIIAKEVRISKVDVEQTLSFYHFLSKEPVGKYAVYLNNSAVACMHGRKKIAKAFRKELGIKFNSVTEDGLIGLWDTADMGMNDQEPAALINGVVFTKLTKTRVKELVAGFREGKDVSEMVEEYGDGQNGNHLVRSMVHNNIRKTGAVLFREYEHGEAIRKAVKYTAEKVIEEVKRSHIRGRGGAGFPTGLKWEFCRMSGGEETYLVCNAAEGERGTFRERVILTELPQQLFEGMVIAAYALGAKEGILYLRYEYKYLKDYLDNILGQMRTQNLLGNGIAGRMDFNFDIRIQMGAGAYVCGEESALIESMEGKRGEPRNRPPFPVQKGYKDMPTVVNNVETLSNIVKIILHGGEWFDAMGSRESNGTKLVSISGDCKRPGVYEIEWGTRIREILKMTGAKNTQAVQVGGPSGMCIGPDKFKLQIAFEDLATGGAIVIIGEDRDLLKDVVLNYLDFFIEESCSSCGPCRSLEVIIRNKLQKMIDGNGVGKDIEDLLQWGNFMKKSNRCGLGQTAANPVLSTLENFRYLYEDLIKTSEDFISTFDMNEAVAESCEYVGRPPNIH